MKKLFTLSGLAIFLTSLSANAQLTGDTSVCAGDVETYYVPVVSGASYTWSITGGTPMSALNTDSLVIQWGPAGTGTIVVTQFNPSAFYTLNVTVHPKPHPLITHLPYETCPRDTGRGGTSGQPDHKHDCEKVCKYSVITYSTALNTGSTYQWVVSGASNVSGANTNSATVTWDGTANGNIIVYETNQWGCIDSSELCVEKVDLPVAYFTHLSSVCKFSSTLFNNLSTGATSYQWYFGDGGSSTQFSPAHSYSNAGNYTITLIAENDCHCRDTFQSVINVDSLPGPVITCPSTVCAFDTASYSTSAGTGCIYNWFAIGGAILSGQGTPNVTVAWGSGQLGTLGLYITGCGSVCSDTTLVYVPIVPTVATISGPNKVCPGDCETYTLPRFSGATYSWTLGGSGGCGAISDSTYCEEVEICWSNFLTGCNDTLTVSFYDSFLNCGGTGSILIRLRPKLEIFGNSPVCSNSIASFSASAGVSCFWSISPTGPTLSTSPSPNVSINWNGMTGTFILAAAPLNSNQVCNDTAYYIVKVIAPPPAPVITGDTIICPNSSVSYCATAANPVNWIITGGTPATGIGNCITVNWGGSGPFIVQAFQQMPVSPYCSSDTATQNAHLFAGGPPNIISSSPFCANATNNFSTNTLYPPGTTYTWSLTPPNAGAILTPGSASTQIQWGNNAPQSVTVTLSVNVCQTVLQNSTTVNLNPVPNPSVIQIGSLCAGGTAQLQAVGGTFTAYTWSGPSFSSNVNPTTISQNGLYQVTVTDANGCTALSQKNVSYVSGPTASISTADPLSYCIGATYSVNICALGNANYQYAWSNLAITQCNVVSAPGSYSVTVTDASNGCTAASNMLVVFEDSCNGVGPGTCIPNGSISFTHSLCNPISFTNTSVNGSSFTWNFGDFLISNLVSPTHTYAQAGFYLVTLSGYVPDAAGTDSCLLSDTAQIEIPLAAKFDFVAGCNGDSVCFTDKSTFTAGNNITSWNWNFGDAGTSTQQSPCHLYSSPGSYIVTLTISNGTCTNIFTDTVVIATPPTAAFTFSNPNCINTPVAFTDASFVNVNYWNWNFGDNGTSLNQNPAHSYNSPGTDTVTLIVRDIYGCYDTIQQNVTVVAPSLSGNITAYPDTIVCSGTNVLLVAPTCGSCTFLWNTGSTNDSIIVNTTGIYTVTLTDANGCPYSAFIRIIVNNGPPALIFNSGSDELCLGEFTSLSTSYNPNWTYYWFSNDGVNNGNTSSGIFVFPVVTGTYTYQVAITDTMTGCSDTSLVYTIIVHPNPVPPTITSIGPSVVCQGDTVMLVGTHPDSTVTILWSTGDVNDTISVTENGCYQLQVTDTNGCKSSATYCVTVNPLPELCSYYTGCVDTCKPFTIFGPAGGTSYQWLFNGNIISGATSQNYTATQNGAYAVIVTNSYGCIDTTGDLNLTLHDCPDSLCAELVIDSVSCDSLGNHVLFYHVRNNSPNDVSQVTLQILSPDLNTTYAPNLVLSNIASGATSPQLSTIIYNGEEEDTLCFTAHISSFDSLGNEVICCYSDTQCVILPPCPEDTASSCCYFHLDSDSIWCSQGAAGMQYNFSLQINGCGQLTIQSPNNGTLNVNNPYTLTAGVNTITGSYIPSSPTDTFLCLTFLVKEGTVYCADTTICFHVNCSPGIPQCHLDFEDSICVGQSSTFSYGGNPSGITFIWQFAGGSPSTATGAGPHTVTYTTAGCHTVICILTTSTQTIDCVDSICVFAPPVASVSQNGNTLYAYPSGMSYQWYGPAWTLLSGETNQFFTPSFADLYCVIVSSAIDCKDTACIDFLETGILALDNSSWNVYPNPNDGSFTLSLSGMKNESVEMKVLNTLGKVIDNRIFEMKNSGHDFYIANKALSAGIYFVQIKTEKRIGFKRIIVK